MLLGFVLSVNICTLMQSQLWWRNWHWCFCVLMFFQCAAELLMASDPSVNPCMACSLQQVSSLRHEIVSTRYFVVLAIFKFSLSWYPAKLIKELSTKIGMLVFVIMIIWRSHCRSFPVIKESALNFVMNNCFMHSTALLTCCTPIPAKESPSIKSNTSKSKVVD